MTEVSHVQCIRKHENYKALYYDIYRIMYKYYTQCTPNDAPCLFTLKAYYLTPCVRLYALEILQTCTRFSFQMWQMYFSRQHLLNMVFGLNFLSH